MIEKQSGSERGNILIVDDTPANLRLLSAMLSEQGYKTRSVVNGQMALMAARSAPPDLILLDINMPEMSGYEVCRALKTDERTRAIPVIFISALDEVLDKVKAFEVGGVDYITKPVQFEEVILRVSTHLSLHRLQHEAQRERGASAVPPGLAALLGRSGPAEVRPGDGATSDGALLVAVVRAGGPADDETVTARAAGLNRLLGGLGAIAQRNGGFVDRWHSASAVAVFPGGLEQALGAARQLRAHVEAQNQGCQERGETLADLGVGLCSRGLAVGVLGDESQVQAVWLDGTESVVSQIEQAVRRSAEPIVFVDPPR